MLIGKTKNMWLISILILISIGCFFIGFSLVNSYLNSDEDVSLDLVIIDEEDDKQEELKVTNYYYVDIKGAVTSPSVYRIESGSRVVDVIKLAGGLTKDADTSVLNLSKQISDEMIIIIYTKREIKKFKEKSNNNNEILEQALNEYKCPDPVINQACIDSNEITNVDNNSSNPNNNKLSINTASMTELQTLPGIGEVKALAIINYRNDNGPFEKIADIKKVSGIGDSTFDKIKDYITI
jgi:competence protein ComEA